MLNFTQVIHHPDPQILAQAHDSLELNWDMRKRSRFAAINSAHERIGVFLTHGTVLRHGDVLLNDEQQRYVRIVAAPEHLLRVDLHPTHSHTLDLMRAAYHLGNRHVAIEIHADHLKIEVDHVLADMLRQFNLRVTAIQSPFEPEHGAYHHH